MAKEGEGFDAIKDLKWLAFVIVGIWIVWVLTGGPSRYEATHGIFLKPPAPLSTGETYGNIPEIKLKIPDTLNVTLYGGRAALGSRMSLKGTNPGEEYLEIVGQSDSPVNITGWKVTGSNGASAVIPQGTATFMSGRVNETKDIYLGRGDRAIIVSGNSPVGNSFRVNSCSGYLAEFQDFTPKLKDACPSPLVANSSGKYSLDSTCLDYINNMDSCETPTSALPKKLTASCRDFILTHTTYNTCAEDSRSNADFYKNEWRVYLNKKEELWGDRDTIKFYDKNNNLIGTYAY